MNDYNRNKMLTYEIARAVTKQILPYIFEHHSFYLCKEPVLDSDRYLADVIRVGDEIDPNGILPVHSLYWDMISPWDLGLLIDDSIVISDTEWGDCTVKELSDKIDKLLWANGIGSFVPIESINTCIDGRCSARCVQYQDSFYGDTGNDIHIYDLSWLSRFSVDIGDYIYLPKFDLEFKGETRKFINTGQIHMDDLCDWSRPSGVIENTGKINVSKYKS